MVGIPMVRPPGVATSRSATSFWTITTRRSTAAAPSSTPMITGTATLYGRLATSVHRTGRAVPRPVQPGGQEAGPVHREGIGGPGPPRTATGPVEADAAQDLLQDRHQVGVLLHREHLRPGTGQGQGQRPEAGTDLHHPVTGPDAGQAHDPPHGVGVGHEVLAQRTAGRQPVAVQQGPDLRGAEHRQPRVVVVVAEERDVVDAPAAVVLERASVVGGRVEGGRVDTGCSGRRSE